MANWIAPTICKGDRCKWQKEINAKLRAKLSDFETKGLERLQDVSALMLANHAAALEHVLETLTQSN
jgi:hypothetical protein